MTDQTVTVGIDKDEWYPVFSFTDAGAFHAETRTIPAALHERCIKAFEEFNEVQSIIEDLYFGEADA